MNDDVDQYYITLEALVIAFKNEWSGNMFSLGHTQQIRQQSNIAAVVMSGHCHSSTAFGSIFTKLI